MITAYRATFRRHRLLLIVPIVIAVVLAVWSTIGAPPTYESTTSLWVDTPPPAASSVADVSPAVTPPAEQEQLVLQELLRTRGFRMNVATRGPLAAYLARTDAPGWGPTELLSRMRGPAPLDRRIIDALGPTRITTTVEGPQVVTISYRGDTPQLAAGTLRALIAGFRTERERLGVARGQGTISYRKRQVVAASKAVEDAESTIRRFAAEHPRAPSTDPNLAALQRALRDARAQLARATAALNQATAGVSAESDDPGSPSAPSPSGISMTVLDAPRVPLGPISGKKKAVMAVFGGLFAGALVSFLGLVALTPSRAQPADVRSVRAMPGPDPAAGREDDAPAPHGDEGALLGGPRPRDDRTNGADAGRRLAAS